MTGKGIAAGEAGFRARPSDWGAVRQESVRVGCPQRLTALRFRAVISGRLAADSRHRSLLKMVSDPLGKCVSTDKSAVPERVRHLCQQADSDGLGGLAVAFAGSGQYRNRPYEYWLCRWRSRIMVAMPCDEVGRSAAPASCEEASMQRVTCGILLLSLSLSAAADGRGQNEPGTSAEQFQALRKEYDRASGSGAPLTDAQRLEFVGRVYKHRHALAEKFVELAQKHPNDPIALDALTQAVWQVNTTPWPVELVGEDGARPKALAIIERDHVRSDKLGPLCERISHGFCEEYETLLRGIAEKNPHESVRATARLSLGHFLHNRLQRIDLCRELPKLAKEFAGLYGEEYLANLLRQDREMVLLEIEAVYEQAVKKHGDLRLAGRTVAELAGSQLYELRNLRVGKPAPDIEGEDQDGRRFKLSEYRGKVVLLDFRSYV